MTMNATTKLLKDSDRKEFKLEWMRLWAFIVTTDCKKELTEYDPLKNEPVAAYKNIGIIRTFLKATQGREMIQPRKHLEITP
ncbi:hypothetical protein NPIL_430651 [Nephila pilipes]|uniref:Uncharacterized protein n=1 Tax=Nephila pilipes TaxID=299642 RepID=A0A8X6QJF8_NEPPI|nr:hypothetical protein NPIL_430651 [Nephila pilipes]